LIRREVDDAYHLKVGTAALWLCFGILAFLLYKFLRPYFVERPRAAPLRTPRSPPSSGFGWFPGGHDDRRPGPPPPYSKHPPSTDNTAGPSGLSRTRDGQDRLGFWSGAALGSLGAYLFTRQRNPDPQPRPYDWERPFPRQRQSYRAASSTPSWHQSSSSQSDNRGEGPSSLGPMTTSTGYGGSSVR
jgi:SOCE-associated regulatory factor of calcium homoeostasis